MVKVSTFAAGLTAALWPGITIAAPLTANINTLPYTDVEPFMVTIKPYRMSLNTTTPVAKAHNASVSAYLLGDAPDPSNPIQQLGFIAQQANNGSTRYFMPQSKAVQVGGAKLGSMKATQRLHLSWDVGPCGVSFKTPGTVNSGRIYIVDGRLDFLNGASGIVQPDPHNPGDIASKEIWGFIEMTHAKGGSDNTEDMTVNLSFVDWVSLPLGMNVTFQEPDGLKTVRIPGLQPDGLAKVCESLSALDSFWPNLCLRAPDQTPLRVMSPEKYMSLHADDEDAASYYEPYIDQVWNKYKNVNLQINTQTGGPDVNNRVDDGQIVTCRVGMVDDILHCDNDAGDFNRPVSRDIYGCNSGPFGNPSDGAVESWSRMRVRPRLCAAFVRSTLHLDGAQPSYNITSDSYYQHPITNHYSRAVHENLVNGMGYAFSYDDVSPDSTENSAGLVSMTRPIRLDIFINK